jgi:pimeloyl-ACP methyl ester carboxylesterase
MHTILIPPLLGSARFFEPLLPTVWSFGSLAIADTRRDSTMADMAQRLLEAAPQHFAVIGTSMGGYLALEVVRQAPERVRALGLISTSARPDDPATLEARAQQSAAVQEGRFDQLVDAVFPALVAPGREHDAALGELWRAMAHDVGVDGFLRQQDATTKRSDSRPLLPRIAVPTAVVHGAEDRFIAPQNARELAQHVPDASLTFVADAGHFAVRERPEAVAAAVFQLLERAFWNSPAK